jgi:hypothetical protein
VFFVGEHSALCVCGDKFINLADMNDKT